MIKIKLKNYGEDAFKPNDYGLHIIVERKISSDGAGSYKVCNERGKLNQRVKCLKMQGSKVHACMFFAGSQKQFAVKNSLRFKFTVNFS